MTGKPTFRKNSPVLLTASGDRIFAVEQVLTFCRSRGIDDPELAQQCLFRVAKYYDEGQIQPPSDELLLRWLQEAAAADSQESVPEPELEANSIHEAAPVVEDLADSDEDDSAGESTLTFKGVMLNVLITVLVSTVVAKLISIEAFADRDGVELLVGGGTICFVIAGAVGFIIRQTALAHVLVSAFVYLSISLIGWMISPITNLGAVVYDEATARIPGVPQIASSYLRDNEQLLVDNQSSWTSKQTMVVAKSQNMAVTECERLTAHPEDLRLRVEPVPFKNIQAASAIKACTNILKRFPGDGHLHYLLARAYWKKEDYSKAVEHNRKAVELGYVPALYAMAIHYDLGEGVPKNQNYSRLFDQLGADRWYGPAVISMVKRYTSEESPDYDAAASLLEAAAERKIPGAHYYLGNVRLKTADPSEAVKLASLAYREELSSENSQYHALTKDALSSLDASESDSQDPDNNILDIQKWLQELGYEPGVPDGIMGDRTRNAIREYEKNKGWEVSGEVTDALLNELEMEVLITAVVESERRPVQSAREKELSDILRNARASRLSKEDDDNPQTLDEILWGSGHLESAESSDTTTHEPPPERSVKVLDEPDWPEYNCDMPSMPSVSASSSVIASSKRKVKRFEHCVLKYTNAGLPNALKERVLESGGEWNYNGQSFNYQMPAKYTAQFKRWDAIYKRKYAVAAQELDALESAVMQRNDDVREAQMWQDVYDSTRQNLPSQNQYQYPNSGVRIMRGSN